MHHRNRQVGSLSSHKGEWNVDITYILMLRRKVMHGRIEGAWANARQILRILGLKTPAKSSLQKTAYLLDYLVQKEFLLTSH